MCRLAVEPCSFSALPIVKQHDQERSASSSLQARQLVGSRNDLLAARDIQCTVQEGATLSLYPVSQLQNRPTRERPSKAPCAPPPVGHEAVGNQFPRQHTRTSSPRPRLKRVRFGRPDWLGPSLRLRNLTVRASKRHPLRQSSWTNLAVASLGPKPSPSQRVQFGYTSLSLAFFRPPFVSDLAAEPCRDRSLRSSHSACGILHSE